MIVHTVSWRWHSNKRRGHHCVCSVVFMHNTCVCVCACVCTFCTCGAKGGGASSLSHSLEELKFGFFLSHSTLHTEFGSACITVKRCVQSAKYASAWLHVKRCVQSAKYASNADLAEDTHVWLCLATQ